jgi:hypothetical protein
MYGFCISCGVPPEYFLDEMSQDEIKAIIRFRTGDKIKKPFGKRLTREELEAKVAKLKHGNIN